MHPRTVGFDMKNIEMTDKLPHVLETLVNSMKSRYNYSLPNIFKNLLSFVRTYITKLLNLHDHTLLNLYDIAQNNCDDLIQHINGLILLKRCDMLDQRIIERSAFENGENVIRQVFNFLVSQRNGELACRDLSAQMIEYLGTLMEFQFSLLSSTIETPVIIPDDTRSMTEVLVELISNQTPTTSVDCTRIKHGEHFLNTFKSVIFKYILTHVVVITHIFDSLHDPSFLLKWTEDLLLFLKRYRRELQVHMDAIVNAILQQFTYLSNSVFNVDSRKERLINIYGIAIHLKSRPMEIMQNREFYKWIRDQLTNNSDLEYKTKILKNFFVCLTDVTDHEDLQRSLQILKDNGRSLCSDLSETSVNAMKVIDCFETLLVLLSTTRSIVMLKCAIHFAAGTGKRLFDEKLEEHLRSYYDGASLEHVLESLQQTYHAFMNMNIIETERLDILRGFLLPAFNFCNTTAIERFFEKNIQDLYSVTSVTKITDDDEAIKQKIVSKIGCFQLLAIMFARVNESKISANKTTGQNNPGPILISRDFYYNLFFGAIEIRSLEIRTQPEYQELVRLLHCSAYNCLLAILSLKKEERFYSWAFADDEKKKRFIWRNIIDCNAQYKLGQTFKEYPKTREIIVNIKSTEVDRDEQRTHRHAYVHSYDLSSCTLSEDINAYDLNKCVVLPSNFRRTASTTNSADSDPLHTHATSIALESTDFNEHECMPYICALLRHIRKTFPLSPNEPLWLQGFLRAMRCDNQNIQLFMLKIIFNTNEVFKPYAGFVLTQTVKTIAYYLQRYDLNYIITDVLKILMDWHDVAVPNSEDSEELFKALAGKILIQKSSSENNDVYNYNLNLIRTMIEKWRSCLREQSELLKRKMISAPAATLYLIPVLLDNDMTEQLVARNDIVDFLLTQLQNWNTSEVDEATTLQCCECLGLYLRSLDNNGCDETERDSKKCEVKERISAILGSLSTKIKNIIKQVKHVAALCQTYPEVAPDYISVVINAMAKGLERSRCLEIFALAISRPNADEIVNNNLRHMGLQRILTNRVPYCEKMALQIVRDMIAIVSPTDLLSYVNLAIQYVKDGVTEYRELVYDILMRTHKKYSADIADNDVTEELLLISVRNLLAGLLDPSPELQDKILKFWAEETNLNTESSKNRLFALLAMHSSRVTTDEDAFTTFVVLLMLQLVTRSLEYNSKMFKPLHNNCIFEEYKIAVSWQRRNLSCRTPMFVDSLASQMSNSIFSQSVENDLRGTASTLSHLRPLHNVSLRPRAQDLQFEQTLLNDTAATTLDISSHDTGFDRATTSRGSLQTAEHKRFTRILTNTSDVMRHQNKRKNVQRAERIKQESIRQRSSVKLYR